MRKAALAAACLALTACAASTHTADPIEIPPAPPIPAFYTQALDAGGIPILASDKVPLPALEASRDMVSGMLAHRPDVAELLVQASFRVAIMAEDETTTDLPEQADWTKPARDDPRLTRCERKHYDTRIGALTDREYWHRRARGMGGRLTSSSVEDVLGQRNSRYFGETILVHEFSHGILKALRIADPALAAQVDAAYAAAQENGLWAGEYAMTNVDEYWAEGTQFWFNSNRLAVMDGVRVLDHTDLAAYDPALYAVLGQTYGDTHRLKSDPFWMHPARVPDGPPPVSTAEVC